MLIALLIIGTGGTSIFGSTPEIMPKGNYLNTCRNCSVGIENDLITFRCLCQIPSRMHKGGYTTAMHTWRFEKDVCNNKENELDLTCISLESPK